MTDSVSQESYLITRSEGRSVMLGAVILAGLVYVVTQWYRTGTMEDALFVGLLFGASIILVLGIAALGRHLIKKGLPFLLTALDDSRKPEAINMHKKMCDNILGNRETILAGAGYGVLVAMAPWVMEIWQEDPILRSLLSLFLFFVNFITGLALYSLVRFMEQTHRLIPDIHIDVWQCNSGKTEFIIGLTRKMVLLASIYISLSMVSLLFSKFSLDAVIVGYALFAALVFISVLVISPAPVVRKLKNAKSEALNELDVRIQQLFNHSDDGGLDNDEQISKLKNLLDLREKIEEMNTWPFRMKSFLTGVSVVLFSSLPVLIQVLLEIFWGG